MKSYFFQDMGGFLQEMWMTEIMSWNMRYAPPWPTSSLSYSVLPAKSSDPHPHRYPSAKPRKNNKIWLWNSSWICLAYQSLWTEDFWPLWSQDPSQTIIKRECLACILIHYSRCLTSRSAKGFQRKERQVSKGFQRGKVYKEEEKRHLKTAQMR